MLKIIKRLPKKVEFMGWVVGWVGIPKPKPQEKLGTDAWSQKYTYEIIALNNTF